LQPSHLGNYVRGQLSDLPRKSAEPIANFAGVAPRTLQEFLRTDEWDHPKLRDRVGQIIARDHADPEAIGVIDDSGHPKKGTKTACVARQYCGRTGKVDNCVVSVHLSYVSYDTRFRAMVDSTPYLPERDWDDPDRRRQAGIPDEVVYRPKYAIGLEQLDRAMANGLALGWITADEWYAQKPAFIAGLEARGQRFVLEVPRNFPGWLFCPKNADGSPKQVDNLCRFSRPMMRRSWSRFYLKDTEKGPIVWEAKAAEFWLRREGQIHGPYWLVVARNVLDPTEAKYFLSNASPGTPLETILHVAFARWPVERCLEDEKSKLGLSDFEVRNYQSIWRHFLLTQVSHLFLGRQTERLRGKKPGGHVVPSPHCRRRIDRRVAAISPRSTATPGTHRQSAPANPAQKRQGPALPYQHPTKTITSSQHHPGATTLLQATLKG
jgi:SRSO17 transposase